MTDKQTPLQISDLGVNARLVLDNPAYQEAMARLRSELVATWENSPIRDREGHLLNLQVMKLTRLFESTLTSLIQAGKMADAQVDIDSVRDESRPRKILRRFTS